MVWNCASCLVSVVSKSDQYMHCEVVVHTKKFLLTVVYGVNQSHGRTELWSDLMRIGTSVRAPWLVIGDLNSILDVKDRIGGRAVQFSEIEEFRLCVDVCHLQD